MIIISHRGNIRGSIPDKENRPSYIDAAISCGFQVEIDIRSINDNLWLGHDEPQYKVDHNWLDKRRNYLWIHCKNLEAAKECWAYHSFCHSQDSFVYTSVGKIWVHDLSLKIDNNTIIPLINSDEIRDLVNTNLYENAYGVCTDYPAYV